MVFFFSLLSLDPTKKTMTSFGIDYLSSGFFPTFRNPAAFEKYFRLASFTFSCCAAMFWLLISNPFTGVNTTEDASPETVLLTPLYDLACCFLAATIRLQWEKKERVRTRQVKRK